MSFRRDRNAFVIGVVLATVSSLTAVAVNQPDEPERAPMETVLESHSETVKTASAWDLPVTRNERVDKWIKYLSQGNADKTRLWLERSGRYEPMIRAQLRARGMPEDLVYLAFIESGFSPRAYSRAAASGMWQFIAETGRDYGLEVNSYVDERRDPIDATRAALDYLQELHDRFGSWYLAAAAYNSGENRIVRILKQHAGGRTGSDDLFWRIAKYLPEETRNYVPLMLAAGHISKTPHQFGFDSIAYQDPLAFDTVWVSTQSSLDLIAKAAAVDSEAVRDLNPHLVKGVTPPGRAYPVRIPRYTRFTFVHNFAGLLRSEMQAEKARLAAAQLEGKRNPKTSTAVVKKTASAASKKPARVVHRVRRGENLSTIAARYDTSVTRIRSLNGLGRKSRIYPGQKLRIS